MDTNVLPLPAHFDPSRVGELWRVLYEERAREANQWAKRYAIRPSARDHLKVILLSVDVQNTFCIPGFELYVGGRSGTAAVDDNRRLCEFIYRNLHHITEIIPTMDTHQAMQIFHAVFLVDDRGNTPPAYTRVSESDIQAGKWRINPSISSALMESNSWVQQYLLGYVRQLAKSAQYDLTIWPYHAMLGGIGHALVAAFEEACFFHSIARFAPTVFEMKGRSPLTECYSVLGPEVSIKHRYSSQKNDGLLNRLLSADILIIAGQAKSHCVAWTISDLLEAILARNADLSTNVYLLVDCTSPVVVPGVVDFTDEAEQAFDRFAKAGMHIVRSTDPMASWPGVKL